MERNDPGLSFRGKASPQLPLCRRENRGTVVHCTPPWIARFVRFNTGLFSFARGNLEEAVRRKGTETSWEEGKAKERKRCCSSTYGVAFEDVSLEAVLRNFGALRVPELDEPYIPGNHASAVIKRAGARGARGKGSFFYITQPSYL